MINNQRDQLRQQFFKAWQKFQNKEPLLDLEQHIITAIQAHPEYQDIFNHPEKHIDKDYAAESGETNPFLHLSFHLGLREQLSTNRPHGIATIYEKLQQKMSAHDAEHLMIDCLAEMLWQAQKDNSIPDENQYMKKLESLLLT